MDFPEKPCHNYDVIVTALIDNTVVVAIFTSNLANLKNFFLSKYKSKCNLGHENEHYPIPFPSHKNAS